LLDARQVVLSEFLDIVVACPIYIVGRVLVLGGAMELLSVVERNYFVTLTVDDIDRTVYIAHAVDVRELVEWEGPAEIEHDAQG